MIPITLDGARVPIALVGRGEALLKRHAWLRESGAERLTVFTDDDQSVASDGVVRRLPTAAELAEARVVWITGLPDAEARAIGHVGRAAGALVNVEDVTERCDFHTPAVVRRGDLLVTVSTGGRSPGLAGRMRAWLDQQIGPEWTDRLEVVATKRAAWRRRQRSLPQLLALTDAVLDRKGWLGRETRR